jgi:hypothetical protein
MLEGLMIDYGFELKGGPYVVDNRGGTDNSVAAGAGEQLYDGWVHPYFDRDRHCRGVDQNHSGPETSLATATEGP